jgi:acetyltransferase
MALIAVVYRNGREVEIGAARYVMREGDAETAEFAIAIADRWHRRGVAERLLRGLIAVAASRGIRWLEGDVLASNRGMLGLARKLGFQSRKPRSDARLVTVSRRVAAQDAEEVARTPARRGWRGLFRSLVPAAARVS